MLFYNFFQNSSIFWTSFGLLAFKRPRHNLTNQTQMRGGLETFLECFKSIFEAVNFPFRNLVLVATRAAFLTFLALKLKHKNHTNKWHQMNPTMMWRKY